ncbi:MAG: transglutaminase family protein [Bosea sp. (in: a-proteobacteria)]|uniref:transglutaminase-like domain-containing protein n=1 Tax=Bosea sp. (in: a-proteobacteria) TaxID=1871050 RepID=UPI0027363B52|nr:transglutaminase family protein [Bosea sp. (in: a-proteobacteria)]MDP3255049.1 transglutaminase family protein [Bosea sp. (in: a-proteobacteria)]MDP3318157.1 transglutaminase family protein [Bosea sp. (in: a-proteobacteria)]
MHIRYGYNIEIQCGQDLPLVTLLDVHPSRRHDLVRPDHMTVTSLLDPARVVPTTQYIDQFGNICRRITAPAGGIIMRAEGIVQDSGSHDPIDPTAEEVAPSRLPDDALVYLMGSRYCETDRLSAQAWSLFGHIPGGWQRVQAIVDFVHNHLTFGYHFARSTRTAAEAFEERVGVCRDFAHLAVALCRCMNIPARYCNGYLGDIGVPFDPAPMDFNAWIEVYLGGRWFTFDARHNQPRIGRVVIARGRDATDVAMVSSFGPHTLRRFEVVTEEVEEPRPDRAMPLPMLQRPSFATAPF